MLNKIVHISLGIHICNYVCGRCLKPYSNQDVLLNLMQQCGQQQLTSRGLSTEPHFYWKKQFHKNPLYFRIDADFDADNGLILRL